MADLVTVAKAKTHLGITGSGKDALIGQIVTEVSGLVEQYLGMTVAVPGVDDVEQYDGDGGSVLVLRRRPVVSLTSIHDDTAREFAASTLVDPSNYYVDLAKGIVRFDGYRMSEGVGNIRVAYRAGYAATPAGMELAVLDLVAMAYNQRTDVGHGSAAMGGQSYAFVQSWPAHVRDALDQWRTWARSR